MYYTTGFSRDEIVDLCAMINTVPVEDRESWPPSLGLFKSVVIALTYMRRNRVQCELAETYGVNIHVVGLSRASRRAHGLHERL